MTKRLIAALLLTGLSLTLGACSGSDEPVGNGNLDNEEVGSKLSWGGGCEDALKKLLRDPDSLQEDEYTVTEATPTRWKARMLFRSKNGFGGYGQGEATCSFDGKTYRVELLTN